MESPLPFIVGITGHRDLHAADLPELETIIRAEFEELERRYPHSSLILLSPLAEGADRLAAHAALAHGIKLIVPLPLPRAIYEQDFATDASRREFDELLARASGYTELPLLPGHTEDDVRCPGPARDQEYAKLGAFVASCSQLLIAVWDGVESDHEKLGGTAQVVRFRLEGVPHLYDPLRSRLTLPVPAGPVCHIATPRLSQPTIAFVPLTRRTLLPAGRPGESFTRLYERIELLNEDARNLQVELAETAARGKAYLLNTDVTSVPQALAELPAPCARLLDYYATTDGLAVHFALETLATLRWIFLGVATTGLLFHLQAAFYHFPEQPSATFLERLLALPWLLIAFLACSAFTALWLHRRAERAEYQAKHQDYRALAEALRIQFYWHVAGFSESVVDSFLRKQRSDLEWIRSALRTWHLLATMSRPGEVTSSAATRHRASLISHWITDQRTYFVSKARKEQRKLDRDDLIVSTLLKVAAGGSIALAGLLAFALLSTSSTAESLRHLIGPAAVQHTIMLMIGTCGVGAALLRAYGDQLARSEHVRQFTRMSELFDAAEHEFARLTGQDRHEAATQLVHELGLEALEDSADWLILHRERPLELPHG